jgi:hypothetical protein
VTDQTTAPAGVVSSTELGAMPEPVGFRTRYRSEPGMIGHYPWTYADHRRRKHDRPECEYEDLFTAEQMRAAVAMARAHNADLADEYNRLIWHMDKGGDFHDFMAAESKRRFGE